MTNIDADPQQRTVLVVGASGSIGRHAVAQSLERGWRTRALVRDPGQARLFPDGAEVVVGDPTGVDGVREALDGVDGVVLVHGSHGGAAAAEAVDYGVVRSVVDALVEQEHRAHLSLMTAIGVTVRGTGHDWKRRGERLVRASGLPYTIVRPGWFDYNSADELALVMLQGDQRRAGSPADGVISRAQIAQVLLDGIALPEGSRKTLELVAERGPAPADLAPLFAALEADAAGSVDGVRDPDTQPLEDEPAAVRARLEAVRGRF